MASLPFPFRALAPGDSDIIPIFNPINFRSTASGFVTFDDLLSYANLFKVNNFLSLNNFVSGITFEGFINEVSKTSFALIQFLPSVIQSITGLAHDSLSNTSSFDGNVSILNDGLIQENVGVGGKVVVGGSVQCQSIQTWMITSPQVNTNHLSIGGTPFWQDIGFLHINGAITLPLCRSTPIADLNLPIDTILTISVKAGFRICFIDLEGNVLANVDNTTGTNYLYQIPVTFSAEMKTIQCFDRKNKII